MEQPFSLTSEVLKKCVVITTSGYVNNAGGQAIAEEFERHFGNGLRHIVINLAGSKVVNSIGMSFLLEIIERLQDAGGKLVFANLDPAVDKMLTIMGIFKVAGKSGSVEEGLRSFEL